MNDLNLKQEFINAFGEEKWKEEQTLNFVQHAVTKVCMEWLGISPISIVFVGKDFNDIARYDISSKLILLNTKYKNDIFELLDSAFHELEHHWQRIYIANNDTLKAKRWKYEFEHYKDATNPLENLTQELEIDAMAFAQVVMENEYGIKVENQNPEIQEIIDKYIISGKILTDD